MKLAIGLSDTDTQMLCCSGVSIHHLSDSLKEGNMDGRRLIMAAARVRSSRAGGVSIHHLSDSLKEGNMDGRRLIMAAARVRSSRAGGVVAICCCSM